MRLTSPIIIVGTGRCGSTLLHRLLATHPDVMWLSGAALLFPARPGWNRAAVTAMGNPALRSLFGRWIRPNEQYRFWDHYTYGSFSAPCRDLVRADLTVRVQKQVRAAFARMLTSRRHRLLVKITGWPRIGFLSGIFEDAKFIHIVRDGRAVANSLLHVPFWRGWLGPQGWRAGLLSPEDQAAWEASGRSFVALAGLEWRIQMRAIEAARQTLDPSQFHEVKYETLCAQPSETCRRLSDFVGLRHAPELEREAGAVPIKDTSDRWRNDLTLVQQHLLDDLLRADLLRYGYGVPRTPETVGGAVGR
jgi:hypothetical protein